MTHKLPALPYAFDALEPSIDAKTMQIHHVKHHQAYVDKLNAALEGHDDLQDKSVLDLLIDLDALPADIRTAVRNNGGGHANHTLFWTIMGPDCGGEPGGNLGDEIDRCFGSFDDFKKKFAGTAAGVFGSGWGWLCVDGAGDLVITGTPNQDNPISGGELIPILGVDVWEHAYYLNYQNRRPDYLEAWWNVVDWDQVAKYHGMVRTGQTVAKIKDWVATQIEALEDKLEKLTD